MGGCIELYKLDKANIRKTCIRKFQIQVFLIYFLRLLINVLETFMIF